jgi:hypothetical protein
MLHSLFVCFVVLGLILIVAGGLRGWQWVRNPWFRLGHLQAIGIVVLQAWLGIWCPLTLLEMSLREKAGAGGSLVEGGDVDILTRILSGEEPRVEAGGE